MDLESGYPIMGIHQRISIVRVLEIPFRYPNIVIFSWISISGPNCEIQLQISLPSYQLLTQILIDI